MNFSNPLAKPWPSMGNVATFLKYMCQMWDQKSKETSCTNKIHERKMTKIMKNCNNTCNTKYRL